MTERERAEQLLENLRSIVELHNKDQEEMIDAVLAFAREARARVLAALEQQVGQSAAHFNPTKDLYEAGWVMAMGWVLDQAKALREEGGQR